MFWLLAIICGVAGVYQLLAILASLRQIFRREKPAGGLPPISILKPIRGLDPGFYCAIRSHAAQDYPEFEILFGVADLADPAVPAIRQLQAQFPEREIRLIHCHTVAPNGKVGVLIDLAREARHRLLLVNDSDIRVQPDYLRRIVAPLKDPRVGLVTCLYRAVASGFTARLEALGIATDFAPSTLVAPFAGVREFGLGSTLLFRAADLQHAGGFEAIADYLADDYQLARRITGLGLRIHLSKVVVETSLQGDSWLDAWRHQLRWMRTIRVSRFDGYLGLPVTFATLWALVAGLAGYWWLAAPLLALRMLMALTAGVGVLRCRITVRYFLLAPLRDLIGVALWIAALWGNTVRWRDRHLRLLPGGRLAARP
jgi:ceramide glucosyltransferase